MSRHIARRSAFTLVELLVVIGIIAILISILLPSLSRARAAANGVQCMANRRPIGQAMVMYYGEDKGFIPGAAATTARAIVNQSNLLNYAANIPPEAPISFTDYYHPLTKMMRLRLSKGSSANAADRYQEYMSLQQFV